MRQVIELVGLALVFGSVLGKNQTEPNVGRKVPIGRIVNGTAVSIENHPFIVRVYIYNFFICAGSIITSKHALSAAQCLDFKPNPVIVSLIGGSATQASGGVDFRVSSYTLHPCYDRRRMDFDVAIVTIRSSFDGYQNIGTIRLQTTELTYAPSRPTWCYVAGWGATSGKTKTTSENLRLVWMQAMPQYNCASEWNPFEITPQMICAALPNTDACSGDRGGPLVCNEQLTGIVSAGDELCEGQYPMIFAKVASSAIRLFIRENAGI
uniref:Uncharacterized protein n=1 Tax=Anopheles atroparvus TaxID=41427 RepID=A0A182J7V9_ANOAO